MVGEWRERPLAELTDNFDGIRVPVKEADRRPGPYPYYGASGVVDHVDDYLFDGHYLLVAEDGENLRTRNTPVAFLAGGKFWVNNHAHVIRGNRHADTRFLMYALSAADISGYLTGSTIPKLTQGNLNRIPLLIPDDIPEQRAIAHILGTLDDKIELNRRMSETLEAMARSLFKSWFVDLDPVRAKAEGRETGLPVEVAPFFPDSFEDSDRGEVPKGWTRAPLGFWGSPLSGGTPSKADSSLWVGEIPWISPKVMNSIHADEAEDFVAPRAVGNGTRIAPAGSTLVMVRGMGLHQEVRVSQARGDVTFNQDVKALVPRAIEPSLLLFALLDGQEDLLGRVESSGHGTGVLPSKILLEHPSAMPRADMQRRLAAHFDGPNDRIASLRAEIRTLTALRDTLLPKLISGELRVPDAERLVAGAT